MLKPVIKQALSLYGFLGMMLLKRNVGKSMGMKMAHLAYRDWQACMEA